MRLCSESYNIWGSYRLSRQDRQANQSAPSLLSMFQVLKNRHHCPNICLRVQWRWKWSVSWRTRRTWWGPPISLTLQSTKTVTLCTPFSGADPRGILSATRCRVRPLRVAISRTALTTFRAPRLLAGPLRLEPAQPLPDRCRCSPFILSGPKNWWRLVKNQSVSRCGRNSTALAEPDVREGRHLLTRWACGCTVRCSFTLYCRRPLSGLRQQEAVGGHILLRSFQIQPTVVGEPSARKRELWVWSRERLIGRLCPSVVKVPRAETARNVVLPGWTI